MLVAGKPFQFTVGVEIDKTVNELTYKGELYIGASEYTDSK